MHKKHLKDELLILKRFPINENDLLIFAFAKNIGKITIKAKGSKRLNSKFTGKIEPLSIITAEIYFSGKSFTLVNASSLIEPPLSSNFDTFETAQKICAILIKTLPNEEPNYELFKNLKEITKLLPKENKSKELLTFFYAKYIEITGHLPELSNNEEFKNLSLEAKKVIKFYTSSRAQRSIKLSLPTKIKTELDTHFTQMIENSFY